MRTIALFGGSFNPPHAGHAAVLQALYQNTITQVDAIWILPTVSHAFDKDLLPYEDRAALVDAMVMETCRPGPMAHLRAHPEIKVVRREEKFMYDTVVALRAEITDTPDIKFILVLGTDILVECQRWHRWDDLITRHVIPMWIYRKWETFSLPGDFSVVTPGSAPTGSIQTTAWDIKTPNVSSTSIRERLANNDLTYLIGNGADIGRHVLEIIEQRGLYGYKYPEFSAGKLFVQKHVVPCHKLESLYPPCVGFGLSGYIRQILDARLQGENFVFTVLIDTAMEGEHYRALREWQKDLTAARQGQFPLAKPKPALLSPPVMYLKCEAEPVVGSLDGWRFLGQAGQYLFWTDDLPHKGLFGSLF